jgi:dTDP-4-amino-4,6-dideoxygalactose transaminase
MIKKRVIRIYELKFEKNYRKKFHIGVDKILNEGFLSNHTFVSKLESKFSNFTRSKFALGTQSGTSALELIFRSLNIKTC